MAIKRLLPLFFIFLSLSSCGQQANLADVQGQATLLSLPVTDTAPKKVRNLARFEREIVKFEEYDKTAAPKAGGILFVGSSSIRLWKTVAEDMAPLPVLNRGFGGATIAEVNHYFQRVVYRYKPKMLVFYAGENDLFDVNTPVDTVVKGFNAFRDSMNRYLPDCRMYFVSVKPSPARWPFQQKFLEANAKFRAICDEDPRWTYVDVIAPMLGTDGRPRKDIYRADSLHMNVAGYAEWSKVLKPTLRNAWKTSAQLVPKAH